MSNLHTLSYTQFLDRLSMVLDGKRIIAQTQCKNPEAIMGLSSSAKAYAVDMFRLIETWRKLRQNKTGTVTTQDADQAILTALLNHERNPFHVSYGEMLQPLLLNARMYWNMSDLMMKHGEPAIVVNPMVARIFDIFPMVVYCLWVSAETEDPMAVQREALHHAMLFGVEMQASVMAYVEETHGS